jgi:hypothetical protein
VVVGSIYSAGAETTLSKDDEIIGREGVMEDDSQGVTDCFLS